MRKLATTIALALTLAGCSGGAAVEPPTPENGLTVRVFNSALVEIEVSALWGGSRIPVRIGTVPRESEADLTMVFRNGQLRMTVESQLGAAALISNPVSITTSDVGSMVRLNVDRQRRELELFEPTRSGN